MRPETFYRELSIPQRTVWAENAGTTIRTLQGMFGPNGFRKRPRDHLIVSLVKASGGQVSLQEAIDYFFVEPIRKLAREEGVASNEQPMQRPANRELKLFDEDGRVCL